MSAEESKEKDEKIVQIQKPKWANKIAEHFNNLQTADRLAYALTDCEYL